jgi:hypothetical protein
MFTRATLIVLVLATISVLPAMAKPNQNVESDSHKLLNSKGQVAAWEVKNTLPAKKRKNFHRHVGAGNKHSNMIETIHQAARRP